MTTAKAAVPPPPPLAKKFVEYMLGFGVSVAIGLAPFLGKFDIPLFKPLLGVLPGSEHDVAIPLSAMLMGFVAICVQWFAEDKVRRRSLSKSFVRVALALVVSTLIFVTISALVTARITVGDGDVAVLLHGFGDPNCLQCHGISPSECIKRISFDPAQIDSCWGYESVSVAKISLITVYLLLTSCFGALVGLLVVRAAHRSG